jgi:hypothetical protein
VKMTSPALIEPFVFDLFADSSSTLTTLMRWRLSRRDDLFARRCVHRRVLSSPLTARAVYAECRHRLPVASVGSVELGEREPGTGTPRGVGSRSSSRFPTSGPLPPSPCSTHRSTAVVPYHRLRHPVPAADHTQELVRVA